MNEKAWNDPPTTLHNQVSGSNIRRRDRYPQVNYSNPQVMGQPQIQQQQTTGLMVNQMGYQQPAGHPNLNPVGHQVQSYQVHQPQQLQGYQPTQFNQISMEQQTTELQMQTPQFQTPQFQTPQLQPQQSQQTNTYYQQPGYGPSAFYNQNNNY